MQSSDLQRPGMQVTEVTTTSQSSNVHPPQYPNQQYPNADYPNAQNQYYPGSGSQYNPSQYSANSQSNGESTDAGTYISTEFICI